MNQLPTTQDWIELSLSRDKGEDIEDARARWSERSESYAHKKTRSGYLSQLIDLLELEPEDSIFDMGCGPGVLGVPLAVAGHKVIFVDFSDGMLEMLKENIDKEGVADRVEVYQRAWQEDWSDIPGADIAVSSRSLTWHDYASAVEKLESKARKKVVITTAAGESPWMNTQLEQVVGRKVEPGSHCEDFIILLNYLVSTGRMPTVDYTVTNRRAHSESEEELRDFLKKSVRPQTSEEEKALDDFLTEHIKPREDGSFELDIDREVRWAVLSWNVRR